MVVFFIFVFYFKISPLKGFFVLFWSNNSFKWIVTIVVVVSWSWFFIMLSLSRLSLINNWQKCFVFFLGFRHQMFFVLFWSSNSLKWIVTIVVVVSWSCGNFFGCWVCPSVFYNFGCYMLLLLLSIFIFGMFLSVVFWFFAINFLSSNVKFSIVKSSFLNFFICCWKALKQCCYVIFKVVFTLIEGWLYVVCFGCIWFCVLCNSFFIAKSSYFNFFNKVGWMFLFCYSILYFSFVYDKNK